MAFGEAGARHAGMAVTGLGHRAAENARVHVTRVLGRVATLLVADLMAYGLLRGGLRLLRDHQLLGSVIAAPVAAVMPPGMLNGWQYACALALGLLVTGSYGRGDSRRSAKRLLYGCALATSLPLWSAIWLRGVPVVAAEYVATTLAVWVALVVERTVIDRLVLRVFAPAPRERILFVGSAEHCERERQSPAFTLSRASHDLGFMDLDAPPDPRAHGGLDDLSATLHWLTVDTVVMCGPVPDQSFQVILDAARAEGCRLLAAPQAWGLAGLEPSPVWRDGQVLIELSTPVVRAPELLLKRLLDFSVAAVGLAALSPVLLLIATLIRLDTPGPVFYASERWGQRGRRIRIWKFRTMVVNGHQLLDADPRLRAQYEEEKKLRNDPRVTRVGALLRRWSMDEIPQLFNVLIGEMSLVGPRPKLFSEESRYGALFPIVLSVPPGMTGLWQVSGRNNLSYEERVALDLSYVRQCSLWLDLKILLQTVPAVTRGVGAH